MAETKRRKSRFRNYAETALGTSPEDHAKRLLIAGKILGGRQGRSMREGQSIQESVRQSLPEETSGTYSPAGGTAEKPAPTKRTPQEIKRRALTLDTSTQPTKPSMSKERVKSLQRAFNAAGFRDKNGKRLKVDGIIGPLTESSVKKALKSIPTITPNSSKKEIKAAQAALRANGVTDARGKPIQVDGIIGPRTKEAIEKVKDLTELAAPELRPPETLTAEKEALAPEEGATPEKAPSKPYDPLSSIKTSRYDPKDRRNIKTPPEPVPGVEAPAPQAAVPAPAPQAPAVAPAPTVISPTQQTPQSVASVGGAPAPEPQVPRSVADVQQAITEAPREAPSVAAVPMPKWAARNAEDAGLRYAVEEGEKADEEARRAWAEKERTWNAGTPPSDITPFNYSPPPASAPQEAPAPSVTEQVDAARAAIETRRAQLNQALDTQRQELETKVKAIQQGGAPQQAPLPGQVPQDYPDVTIGSYSPPNSSDVTAPPEIAPPTEIVPTRRISPSEFEGGPPDPNYIAPADSPNIYMRRRELYSPIPPSVAPPIDPNIPMSSLETAPSIQLAGGPAMPSDFASDPNSFQYKGARSPGYPLPPREDRFPEELGGSIITEPTFDYNVPEPGSLEDKLTRRLYAPENEYGVPWAPQPYSNVVPPQELQRSLDYTRDMDPEQFKGLDAQRWLDEHGGATYPGPVGFRVPQVAPQPGGIGSDARFSPEAPEVTIGSFSPPPEIAPTPGSGIQEARSRIIQPGQVIGREDALVGGGGFNANEVAIQPPPITNLDPRDLGHPYLQNIPRHADLGSIFGTYDTSADLQHEVTPNLATGPFNIHANAPFLAGQFRPSIYTQVTGDPRELSRKQLWGGVPTSLESHLPPHTLSEAEIKDAERRDAGLPTPAPEAAPRAPSESQTIGMRNATLNTAPLPQAPYGMVMPDNPTRRPGEPVGMTVKGARILDDSTKKDMENALAGRTTSVFGGVGSLFDPAAIVSEPDIAPAPAPATPGAMTGFGGRSLDGVLAPPVEGGFQTPTASVLDVAPAPGSTTAPDLIAGADPDVPAATPTVTPVPEKAPDLIAATPPEENPVQQVVSALNHPVATAKTGINKLIDMAHNAPGDFAKLPQKLQDYVNTKISTFGQNVRPSKVAPKIANVLTKMAVPTGLFGFGTSLTSAHPPSWLGQSFNPGGFGYKNQPWGGQGYLGSGTGYGSGGPGDYASATRPGSSTYSRATELTDRTGNAG